MCLPCFPWTWTKYEDPLDTLPEQSVWIRDGNTWALQKIQPVAAAPQGYVVQPGMVPLAQQPVMLNPHAYVPVGAPGIPGQPMMSAAAMPAPMMAAAAAPGAGGGAIPIIPAQSVYY